MRRTERLFALAEYLRGRRTGVTAGEIAERFGVTVRTVFRDLEALRDASLPVHGERGRGGGVVLDRSYTLPPVNFTAREAAILVKAGRLLIQQRLLPFVGTIQTAVDKVHAALPARAQRELGALMESLQFVGVPARSAEPKVLAAIEQAWFDGASLEIEYEGAQGRTTRRVKLVSVVMERTVTLLNCHDIDKNDARQFKLHQVLSARLLPRT